MSRAFVDESASESSEGRSPELRIPLPPGSRNYVTPRGAARLQAELEELRGTPTPRLPEAERRLEYLSRMRALMEVVPAPAAEVPRVVFATQVTVREPGGAERSYRIVGVDESDPAQGAVSWISPVARALTGKRRGERACISLPDGEQVVTVLSIRPIPENPGA